MGHRLKVLLSAYACEPGKGSEPEVGWQWALAMARFHDVTVLTRANNRENIDKALGRLPPEQPRPDFVYHDCRPLLLQMKRRFGATKLYYTLWQKSARDLVARVHRSRRFDLMHHVTFAGFRYPTVIWGHGVPSVWGPVGGIESIPWQLLPWSHPGSLGRELQRNVNNFLQITRFSNFLTRARASTVILATTPEMQRTFQRFGFAAHLVPTIGLHPEEMPPIRREPRSGPLKLLFVGNIIALKGADLAIEALKISGTDSTLAFIGDGEYLAPARRKVERLGLSARVGFLGRKPRQEVLKDYQYYDVFLFPSLHDTGGFAVIEAMFNSLPVICLDCGGPAVAVQPACGIRVPLGSRESVIKALAEGIKLYHRDRSALQTHGRNARENVLRDYSWQHKAERMHELYLQVLAGRDSSPTASDAVAQG